MRRTSTNKRLAKLMSFSKKSLEPGSDLGKCDEQFLEAKENRITRRQLLGFAAGMGAAIALPGCKYLFSKTASNYRKDRRVVILGAGAAGMTAAYRLMQAGVFATVYEGDAQRIGGRIWTHRNFNSDRQFVERGAELVDTLNENLIPLAQELGLEIELFENGDKGVIEEYFYYRGKRYTDEDLYKGLKPLLVSVAKDIEAAFPDGVDSVTYKTKANQFLKKFDQMSLAEYFASKSNMTDAWVLQTLGHSYMTEYGDDLSNQSALNFLSIADTNLADGFSWYGASDESRRVKGGNGQIVERLFDRVNNQLPINLGHTLVAIKEVTEGIKLTFSKTGGGTVETIADQVICTLPFTTLRLVDGIKKLNLNRRKKESIANLGYGMNVKHMVGFKNKLWRQALGDVPASTGMLTTDLGVGMVWETSRLQAGQSGILTNFLGGSDGVNANPSGNLNRMLTDLDKFWNGISKMYDGNSIMQHWPSVPLARGSYCSPKVGQYLEFFGCEGETELNGRLLFAGEHTSPDWWGYMNGAIQSGERAAKEVITGMQSEIKRPARKWKIFQR